MRYFFKEIKVRTGEYEFEQRSTHTCEDNEDIDKILDDYIQDYYSNECEDMFDNEEYYFFGGEVAVSLNNVTEITKEEYEVLRKFIY
jgi:hypothetical protein